jgi:hypothetical protein
LVSLLSLSLTHTYTHLGSQDCKNEKKQFVNLNNSICHTPSHSFPLFLHMFPNRSSPLSPPRRPVTQIFPLNLLQFSQISWFRSWFQACWWPKTRPSTLWPVLIWWLNSLLSFNRKEVVESKQIVVCCYLSYDFYGSVSIVRKWVLLRFCFFGFLGIICNLGFF